MSDGEDSPVEWLRAQVKARKALAVAACGRASRPPGWVLRAHPNGVLISRDVDAQPVVMGGDAPSDAEAEHMAANGPRDVIAQCEAELAILDRCEALLPPDPEDLDEHYHDGRDPGEQMRDEALAELADDVLALLADGYRHREGWTEQWACPGCGRPIREVPLGHMWGISLPGGEWMCSAPGGPPLSPGKFIAGATPG